MISPRFKVACVQLSAGRVLEPNIVQTCESVRRARDLGADLILTPENTGLIEPIEAQALAKALPEDRHPAIPAFADLARETGAWLVIGSLSIATGGQRYANRCYVFAPDGSIAARYSKIHLFDVDLKEGESYRESAIVAPGDQAVLADLPWGRLGLSICYDLRFASLYRTLAQAGAQFLSVPAAFTVPTGRAHWHVLLRARAIETGSFVFAPAQCGVHAEGRRTYGHSLIITPWGEILAEAGEAPDIITADIDVARVAEARSMIPALRHDRPFGKPSLAVLSKAS